MANNGVIPAIERSIEISSDDISPIAVSTPGFSMNANWIAIGEELPPWWSTARDRAQRKFWKGGDHISGVMYNAQTKLSGIPMKVVARDRTITKHVKQAEEMTQRLLLASEFGQTMAVTRDKFNEDYLGTDNGAFMELLGDGPKDGFVTGPVISVRHLDSIRCTRTGDPEFPVVYTGTDSIHKLHWSRVVFMSQMPSSSKLMNGVGFSSVSRSTKLAKDLINILNYKGEKMGSRPQSQILVGKGIEAKEIMRVFLVAEKMMDDLGLKNYAKTVAIGGSEDIDLERIVMNDFDPFNEEMSVTLDMFVLAFCWGLEFNEVFPMTGSKSSDQVALQRARGKLPVKYTHDLKLQLDLKLVPSHLEVIFDFQDDTHDMQRANVNDIRARNRSRNLESGATTVAVERRSMVSDGAISWEDAHEMQLRDGFLPDGRPIGAAFFDPKFKDLLGDMGMFIDTSIFEAEQVIPEIEKRRLVGYVILGEQSGQLQRQRAMQMLRALEWLESLYVTDEVEEEIVEEEVDDEEVAKSKGFFTSRMARTLKKNSSKI